MRSPQESIINNAPEADVEATSLPFRPPPEMTWLHDRLKAIPRHLFRVSTPDSDGTTGWDWVKSMSVINGHSTTQTDYFARDDPDRVADEINNHLRWWHKDHDNLVSWSSSLLFILQYAFFRCHRSKDKRSKRSNIYVCIIDTTQFGEGTFIQDLDLIRAFKHYHFHPNHFSRMSSCESSRQRQDKSFQGYHYFGEYLSQGALKVEGKICMVTLESLIDGGVLSMHPSLNTKPTERADDVLKCREVFYKQETCFLSEEQCQATTTIAGLFGDWRVPVAANLLGMLPRRKNDWTVMLCLNRLNLSDAEKARCSLLKKTLVGPSMPEVEQARYLYNEFCLSLKFDEIKAVRSIMSSRNGSVNGGGMKGWEDEGMETA